MIPLCDVDIRQFNILRRLDKQFLDTVKSFVVFDVTVRPDQNETHLLLLTRDDRVYGIGKNQSGTLGLGHKNAVTEPTEIECLRHKQVVSVVCGDRHVLALTARGEVYSWGDNQYTQLGHNRGGTLNPTLVAEHIEMVACGGWHCLALNTSGEVISWGWNQYGQLGNGETRVQMWAPSKVTGLSGQRVKMVQCGMWHSMAVTDQGQLYAWGSNGYGKLGIGSLQDTFVPQLVTFPDKQTRVRAVACGSGHTLILTDSGEVWSCGLNESGQLGCPSLANQNSPVRVDISPPVRLVSTHRSSATSVAQTENGQCLVWGDCGKWEQVYKPREVLSTSPYDVFAEFSKTQTTPPALAYSQVEPESSGQGDKLSRMFDDPGSSDIQFEVEGRVIHAHRCILEFHSDYMRRLLSETWCRSKLVAIRDYPYNIFHAYLRYVYTDHLAVSEVEDSVKLLGLADCYLDDQLKHKCVAILRPNLSVDNCCALFVLSQKYSLAEFGKHISRFVSNHVSRIYRTEGFRAMNAETCKQMLCMAGEEENAE